MRTLVLALAVGACYEPDVGPAFSDTANDAGNVGGCDNSDSDPSISVSFALDVRPLMTKSPGGCGPCHLGRITAGLDLSSYQALRRGGLNSGDQLVVANEPCTSVLLQKVGRTPPFGSQMPLNGPPYYSGAELQLLRDWIAEGAANN